MDINPGKMSCFKHILFLAGVDAGETWAAIAPGGCGAGIWGHSQGAPARCRVPTSWTHGDAGSNACHGAQQISSHPWTDAAKWKAYRTVTKGKFGIYFSAQTPESVRDSRLRSSVRFTTTLTCVRTKQIIHWVHALEVHVTTYCQIYNLYIIFSPIIARPLK